MRKRDRPQCSATNRQPNEAGELVRCSARCVLRPDKSFGPTCRVHGSAPKRDPNAPAKPVRPPSTLEAALRKTERDFQAFRETELQDQRAERERIARTPKVIRGAGNTGNGWL